MASWLRSFPPWAKALVLIGGGTLIGLSSYGLVVYFEKRRLRFTDEGFEDVEEQPEKRILVLGLDGAGKSSFLANLSRVENEQIETKPTEGFNVICVNTRGTSINIWEIGGADKVRSYWYNFLQDTDTLVFVVDSTDKRRLPQAFDEFQKLISDERLKNVPVLILANKQDLSDALSPKEIEEALDLKGVSPKQHRLKVMGTHISPLMPQHSSIKEAESEMIKLAFNK